MSRSARRVPLPPEPVAHPGTGAEAPGPRWATAPVPGRGPTAPGAGWGGWTPPGLSWAPDGSGPGPGGGHPASPGSGGGEATRPQDEEPTNLEWILEPFAYEEMLAIWPTIVSSWRGLAAQRVRRPPLPACACPCSRACACPPARLPACPPARLPTCRFSRQPVSPPGGQMGAMGGMGDHGGGIGGYWGIVG